MALSIFFIALSLYLVTLESCEGGNPSSVEFQTCPKRKCNQNIDCWVKTGTPDTCVCDEALCSSVCVPVTATCPEIVAPENGKVDIKNRFVGNVALFSCNANYAMKGHGLLRCQANRKWSHPEPKCYYEFNKCLSPPYLRNVDVLDPVTGKSLAGRDNFTNGEKIKLSCKKGFNSQSLIAVCNGNQWKYSPLSCQKVSCPTLDLVVNGNTRYIGDRSYNTKAYQSCHRGYETRCSITKAKNVTEETVSSECKLVCGADGKWIGPKTNCEPLRCPKILQLKNGSVTAPRGNLVIGTKVRFECNTGFSLVGPKEKKCQENGQWSGSEVQCKILQCPPVPLIKNAKIINPRNDFGSIVEFRCEEGSKPSPDITSISCDMDNKTVRWKPVELPSCNIDCLLIPVRNGRYLNNSLTANTRVPHKTVLKINCKQGYEVDKAPVKLNLNEKERKDVDKDDPVCMDGVWSKNLACVPASCKSRPPQFHNASVKFFSRRHGSVARYICDNGFKAKNPPNNIDSAMKFHTYTCENGVWIGEEPKCEKVSCKHPKEVPGINVLLRQRYRLDRFHQIFHGEKVYFECENHTKYRLVGPKIALCSNGEWVPREMPSCELITHDIFHWGIFFKEKSL